MYDKVYEKLGGSNLMLNLTNWSNMMAAWSVDDGIDAGIFSQNIDAGEYTEFAQDPIFDKE